MGQITLARIPHDKQVAVHSLHALGYSTRKIAQSVDISTNVVCKITHEIPSNLDDIDTFKKGLLLRQYGIAQRATNYITDDKLDKMNALQLMTINAIGIDKARDMEGANRPVFNVVTVVNGLEKRLNDLSAQKSALLALEGNQNNVVS